MRKWTWACRNFFGNSSSGRGEWGSVDTIMHGGGIAIDGDDGHDYEHELDDDMEAATARQDDELRSTIIAQ